MTYTPNQVFMSRLWAVERQMCTWGAEGEVAMSGEVQRKGRNSEGGKQWTGAQAGGEGVRTEPQVWA